MLSCMILVSLRVLAAFKPAVTGKVLTASVSICLSYLRGRLLSNKCVQVDRDSCVVDQ